MSDALETFLKRMEPVVARLEAQPDRPLTQAEIEELRATLATLRRIVSFLTTLGWMGKWLLWALGGLILFMSQLDELTARIRGWLGW